MTDGEKNSGSDSDYTTEAQTRTVRSLDNWTKTSSFYFTLVFCGLATLMLGAVAGFIAGASSTPTVNTLLPLLIAFIVGSGGFFFARIDFETLKGQISLLLTGITMFAFISSFSIALYFGIDARMNSGRPALTLPSEATPEETIKLALLDRRLALVGVDQSTRAEISRRYGERLALLNSDIPNETITELYQTTSATLASLSPTDRRSLSPYEIEELEATIDALTFLHQSLKPWLNDSSGMPFVHFAPVMKDWHRANPKISRTTMALYRILHDIAEDSYLRIDYAPGNFEDLLALIVDGKLEVLAPDVDVMPLYIRAD